MTTYYSTQRLSITAILIIITSALLTSCGNPVYCEKGKGSITTVTREVQDFTHLVLKMDADITVIRDTTLNLPLLEINAQENLMEKILTIVTGGKLLIYNDGCFTKNKPVTIRIFTPEIEKYTITGSGNIISRDIFDNNAVDATITGSGDIELALSGQQFNAKIDGSGKITATGNATSATQKITGSGDIHSFNLQTVETTVNITGSGKAEVSVTSRLTVDISGSGKVRYKGNPELITNISGSGKVEKVD